MSRKKTHKSFLQKMAQVPLILFFSVSGNLARGVAAQVNASPENTQQDAALAPRNMSTYAEDMERKYGPDWQPGETQWKRAAEFHERQEKLLQVAENVVFSQDKSTADALQSYRFLNGSLNGINAVRLAESRDEKTGENILFVYKQGPLLPDARCSHDGCCLDVYADDGKGFKKALTIAYAGGSIHVSRVKGQVGLFIVLPQTSSPHEWYLKGNSFASNDLPLNSGMPMPHRVQPQ
jgi:hypothetical protein